jgi:hypothetical protein
MVATLSNDAILTRKEESLNAQALRKTVPVRDIKLIDEKTIEYQGHRIGITNGAFKSLMKIIGMSKQFADRFERLFNAEAKAQFINTVKNAMASNRGNLSQITLVLNPVSKLIVNFTKHSNELISNSQFIENAEEIIDRGKFGVVNWTTDPGTGIITINAFNPNASWAVPGDETEVFQAGITLKNSPITGFQVSPYVNRMWCTNGLTTSMAADTYNLTSLTADSMEKFNEYLRDLAKRQFMPTEFDSLVKKAKNTAASLKEMQWAHKLIKDAGAGDRADNWIPLAQNELAYSRAGVSTSELNSKELANATTDQSIWSIVNGVTHFATHGQDIVEGVQAHDGTRLMVQAGNILGKDWNLGNQVRSPFSGFGTQVGELLN